jgi:hypothetical protein
MLAVVFSVVVFFVTIGFAFYAAAFAFSFATASAFLFATGEGDYVKDFDGVIRVVAMDDEFAALRVTAGVILDNHSETTARMEFCRERVVDKFEVAALAAEGDPGDMQDAVADIADGESFLGNAAIHLAEAS